MNRLNLITGIMLFGAITFAASGEGTSDYTVYNGSVYGKGFQRDGDEIICDNGETREGRGIFWRLGINGKNSTSPFTITAESKAERGEYRSPSADYAIYVDITYRDGSHEWTINKPFEFEPKLGWQTKSLRVVPGKPMRQATCYLLFRFQPGCVRFRKPNIVFDGGDGKIPFDMTSIATNSAALPIKSGFMIRDVANNGEYVAIAPGEERLGVKLAVERRTDGEIGRFKVKLSETTGADRAMTLVYVERLPRGGKLVWHAGPRSEEQIQIERGIRRDVTYVGAGEGFLSHWPFAATTANGEGRSIGYDPTAPAIFRASLSCDFRALYIAFDIGFAKEHPSADFGFVTFPFKAADSFRGALAEYQQRVYPDHYRVRLKKHGIWTPWQHIGDIEGWEDFGFAVHEGEYHGEWDKAHGIVPFRYTEPSSWWMSMSQGGKATYEECIRHANELASKGDRRAKAWQASAIEEANGRIPIKIRDTPWCKGACMLCSPLPGIKNGDYELKVGYFNQKAQGEYIDSAEFSMAPRVDFCRAHFAAAKTPLAFDPDTKKTVVAYALAFYEYVSALSDRCHAIGRYLMGNGIPGKWPWLVPYCDYGGRETIWIARGKGNNAWTPESDGDLIYYRAMSGGKPYGFLQNTEFEKFTPERTERYFQRCLAYGFFPGYFSPNACDAQYFARPEMYNRDRHFFKKYIPILRRVSEALWRPVNTLATIDNPKVFIEQFGDDLLTVRNSSEKPETFTITLRQPVPAAKELVTERDWQFVNGSAKTELPPDTTRVLSFERGK